MNKKIVKLIKKAKQREKIENDSKLLKIEYNQLLKLINKCMRNYRKRRPKDSNYHSFTRFYRNEKKLEHEVIGYIKDKELFELIINYIYSSEFVKKHYDKQTVKEYVDFQLKEYLRENINSKEDIAKNIIKEFEKLHEWKLLFPLDNIELNIHFFKLGPHKIIKFTRYYEIKWKQMINNYIKNSSNPKKTKVLLEWFDSTKKNIFDGSICTQIIIKTGDSKKALEKAKKEHELFLNIIKYMSWLCYDNYNKHTILSQEENFLRQSIVTGFSESGGLAGIYENKNPFPFQFTKNNMNKMQSYGTKKIGDILNINEYKRTNFQKLILKGINLYGDGISDTDYSSGYVKLVTVLEHLLVKKKESISINLSERIAFLLNNLVDVRKEIYKNIRYIYQIRCDIVHSGEKEISNDEFNYLKKVTFNILLVMINCHNKFNDKNKFIEKINEIKFGRKYTFQRKQILIGKCW